MEEIVRLELQQFKMLHGIQGKGSLALILHITRKAIEKGLPLNPDEMLTRRGGQVQGTSGKRIASILAEHGEHRHLASEGGRTSRGSIDNMRAYVALLNRTAQQGGVDLHEVEAWWVDRIREYFDSKPLVLQIQPGHTYEAIVSNLLTQAAERQKMSSGMTYVGTVLQHLIGAKLEILLGNGVPKLHHHGASVADQPSDRVGDFQIERTVIHVTTVPTSDLFRKCKRNIAAGLTPIIVTRFSRTEYAQMSAEDVGIRELVEIIPAEQFMASNLHEWIQFDTERSTSSLQKLVRMYNMVISIAESDQSLRIEFEA